MSMACPARRTSPYFTVLSMSGLLSCRSTIYMKEKNESVGKSVVGSDTNVTPKSTIWQKEKSRVQGSFDPSAKMDAEQQILVGSWPLRIDSIVGRI